MYQEVPCEISYRIHDVNISNAVPNVGSWGDLQRTVRYREKHSHNFPELNLSRAIHKNPEFRQFIEDVPRQSITAGHSFRWESEGDIGTVLSYWPEEVPPLKSGSSSFELSLGPTHRTLASGVVSCFLE